MDKLKTVDIRFVPLALHIWKECTSKIIAKYNTQHMDVNTYICKREEEGIKSSKVNGKK